MGPPTCSLRTLRNTIFSMPIATLARWAKGGVLPQRVAQIGIVKGSLNIARRFGRSASTPTTYAGVSHAQRRHSGPLKGQRGAQHDQPAGVLKINPRRNGDLDPTSGGDYKPGCSRSHHGATVMNLMCDFKMHKHTPCVLRGCIKFTCDCPKTFNRLPLCSLLPTSWPRSVPVKPFFNFRRADAGNGLGVSAKGRAHA